MQDPWLLLADDEYFVPVLSSPDTPGALAPSRIPEGWAQAHHSVWRNWHPAHASTALPPQGWKVHVSATPDRLAAVLDTVAEACFEHGIAFKHLGSREFFLLFHQKHSSRVQAGKFCAAYPGDPDRARALMERLDRDLQGEHGAYVLTDRRFGSSKVVHYRYGAFARRERLRVDGTSEPLVLDASGAEVPDERRPSFVLPAGITDPFVRAIGPTPPERASTTAPRTTEPSPAVRLAGRFEIKEAIRHSNGGGAYTALDILTGRAVFVKEARAHNGYTAEGFDARELLRREFEMLTDIHAKDPGLCPEPLGHFALWEHEFLVTEHFEGVSLLHWAAEHQALTQLDNTAEVRREYLRRVVAIDSAIEDALRRLHALGLRFGDLSHGNVMVLPDDTVRLIDFETATAFEEAPLKMRTLGYAVPAALRGRGIDGDDYGASALAMLLLFPLARPLEIDPPGRLELHRRDLESEVPLPESLWAKASRFYGAPADTAEAGVSGGDPLPTADELDEDPQGALTRLGDGIAAGILAMAQPDREQWLFPPAATAYSTNTHCLAHGSAGVLHGLRAWGTEIPARYVDRLRDDAMAAAAAGIAPGLQTGLAGIAMVLAELGRTEEARELLAAAERHPLLADSVLRGNGLAGVGSASLAAYQASGSVEFLAAAERIAERLLADDLAGALTQARTPGLEQGLSGVALFLDDLGRTEAGAPRHAAAALRLIHAELDKAVDGGEDGLRFYDAGGRRVISYLSIGSAGVASALTRIAESQRDARCLEALPRVLIPCRATSSVEPGLATGLASWVYALAEHADHAGGRQHRPTALRVATSLTKYAVRFPGGLRVLGSFEHRFHCDLASGDAGVLLALAKVLDHAQGASTDAAPIPSDHRETQR